MTVGYFERRCAGDSLGRTHQFHRGVWAHVSGTLRPSELAEQFGLDENIVRDAADVRELPRMEYSGGIEYVFVRLPLVRDDMVKTAPLLAAVSKTQFVTINPADNFSPQTAEPFLTTTTDKPGALLAATIACAVAAYEQQIHDLASNIAAARHRLSRHEVKNADFIEFVAIEDSLNEFHSSLEGLASVLGQLALNRRGLFTVRDLEALGDLVLHVKQLLVMVAANSQTITSIQNAYSTIANNVLNQRMKVLTAITILLAIPNVFYGMYGMNITLPFQGEAWAYPVITGFTVLLIGIVYIFAKRLRLF